MLAVSRKILINAPKPIVAAYLRDISHLAEYEQKVDSCRPSYPEPDRAVAEVEGRYFGLRWAGTFEMTFTPDGGFRSRMVQGPLKNMVGGFHLKPVAGGTMLTHDEQYGFPPFVWPLYPMLRRRIARSMELELLVIKERAEAMHRHQMRKEIDGQVRA